MAKKKHQPKLIISVLIGIFTIAIALFVANIPTISALELDFLDFRFQMRGPLDVSESPIIILAFRFKVLNMQGRFIPIKFEVDFDLKHFRDVERLAIVGDKPWQKGLSLFCKPFTSAKVKYFDHADLEEAKTWLAEE